MLIIMNEKEWVEDVMRQRYLGNKRNDTLKRVARYMYHVDGFRGRELRNRLERFLLRCNSDARMSYWDDRLDKIAKGAGKYKLISVDEVCVTEAELETIRALDNRQPKRLAFTLLCLAKYWNAVNPNNNNWVTTPSKEIMKMANINTSEHRQDIMLFKMKEIGLFSFPAKLDSENIRVLFLQDDSPVALRVEDFRNLGNQYHMYCGERFISCACCGLVVGKKNNSQKYCAGCASEIYVKKNANYAGVSGIMGVRA